MDGVWLHLRGAWRGTVCFWSGEEKKEDRSSRKEERRFGNTPSNPSLPPSSFDVSFFFPFVSTAFWVSVVFVLFPRASKRASDFNWSFLIYIRERVHQVIGMLESQLFCKHGLRQLALHHGPFSQYVMAGSSGGHTWFSFAFTPGQGLAIQAALPLRPQTPHLPLLFFFVGFFPLPRSVRSNAWPGRDSRLFLLLLFFFFGSSISILYCHLLLDFGSGFRVGSFFGGIKRVFLEDDTPSHSGFEGYHGLHLVFSVPHLHPFGIGFLVSQDGIDDGFLNV